MEGVSETVILNSSGQIKNTKFNIQDLFENILLKLKVKVSAINIESNSLHLIIKYVMESVEETPIKGSEQKEMAVKLIKALIMDLANEEEKDILIKLINDGTIGNMIDLIVDATKGRLNINNAVKVTSRCLNRCIPYLC